MLSKQNFYSRMSYNKMGMYDLVNKQYVISASSSNFTVGL